MLRDARVTGSGKLRRGSAVVPTGGFGPGPSRLIPPPQGAGSGSSLKYVQMAS